MPRPYRERSRERHYHHVQRLRRKVATWDDGFLAGRLIFSPDYPTPIRSISTRCHSSLIFAVTAGPNEGRATPSLRKLPYQHTTTTTGRRSTYLTIETVRTNPTTSIALMPEKTRLDLDRIPCLHS